MAAYQTILFDLDGTITDSGPGITNSVAYALRKRGYPVPGAETLRRFIGPPLVESFMRFTGLDEAAAQRAVEDYREYYRAGGIFENAVYPGIPGLLAALKAAGKTVVLATSKPEDFARQILAHFELAAYFDVVAGATMDERRTAKAEVIAYALAQLPHPGPAVMVGDREHDVLGAKAQGLPCIGVLFGYGTAAELQGAGAAALAPTVGDLYPLLGGTRPPCR